MIATYRFVFDFPNLQGAAWWTPFARKRHDGAMPNYSAKGTERMRELGQRGGVRSGATRRLKRVERLLGFRPMTPEDYRLAAVGYVWEATGGQFTLEQITEYLRPADNRGGSHDTDWRCGQCGHFSSIKKRMCANCGDLSPRNGRLTRAALRARREEHRIQAILAKFGLSAGQL